MSISESINLKKSGIIEASAGTGKTYTITNLVIRLIVGFAQSIDDEHLDLKESLDPMDLENILISTFTKAATEELKARILDGIIRTRECFEIIIAINSDPKEVEKKIYQFSFDDFLVKLGLLLLKKAEIDKKERNFYLNQSIRRLQNAENKIDLAPIKTMHGFCQAVLVDHAFESGAMFKTTVIQDASALESKADSECSRELLYNDDIASDPALAYLYETTSFNQVYQDTKINRIEDITNDVVLTQKDEKCVKVTFNEEYFLKLFNRINDIYHKLIKIVPWYKKDLNVDTINDFKAIKQNAKYKKFKLAKTFSKEGYINYLNELIEIVDDSAGSYGYLGSKENYDYVISLIKELLALNEKSSDFYQNFDNQVKLWQVALADKIRNKISVIKDKNNLLGFDDIIKNMHHALTSGNSSEKLAATLRKRYPVAILDEFQDTDRYQYEIFKKIYLDSHDSNLRLLVIGDPKQAIYSFRSADVYTYLEAKREIGGDPVTLDTNYRSNKGLVDYVNTIFAPNDGRNVFSKDIDEDFNITFSNSKSKYELESLKGKEVKIKCENPNYCFFENIKTSGSEILPSILLSNASMYAKNDKGLGKGECVNNQSNLAALHAAYLLKNGKKQKINSDGKIEENAIRPKDIAVLVSNQSEAESIKKSLSRLNIRSVYLSDRSDVSDNKVEITFFQDFMASLLDLENRELAMQLLSNPLLFKSLMEIEATFDSATDYGKYLELLRSCRELWDRRKFMASFIRFISSSLVLLVPRVMNSANGDRILTNIFHIAEIIQNQSIRLTSPVSLKKWYDDMVLNKAKELEEVVEEDSNRIRLESQEDLVRIVTIHSSKGLQYPIVLLPFANIVKVVNDAHFTIHHIKETDAEGKKKAKIVLDIAGGDKAKKEELEEKFRLLYVALTRAELLLWMDISQVTSTRSRDFNAILDILLAYKGITLNKQDIEEQLNETELKEKKTKNSKSDLLTLEKFAMFLNEHNFTDFNVLNFDTACFIKNNKEHILGAITDKDVVYQEENKIKNTDLESCSSEIFEGHIDRCWEITSFSRLNSLSGSHGKSASFVIADKAPKKEDDEFEEVENVEEDINIVESNDDKSSSHAYLRDRFHFPRGEKPGSFLHSIMEVINPLRENETKNLKKIESLKDQIKSEVEKSFFASSKTLSKWTDASGIDALTYWYRLITETPLDFGDSRIALNEINPEYRLPEVPFTFSLGTLKRKELDDYLKKYTEKGLWVNFEKHELDASGNSFEINGFLTGVIDLLFYHNGKYYVLDYKSNYITDDSIDYNKENLEIAVVNHRYDLQYAIYSLATYRFLKSRVPNFDFERDFGGVLYLFIRGLPDNYNKQEPPQEVTGCFYQKIPGNEFIQGLDRIFGTEKEKNKD